MRYYNYIIGKNELIIERVVNCLFKCVSTKKVGWGIDEQRSPKTEYHYVEAQVNG